MRKIHLLIACICCSILLSGCLSNLDIQKLNNKAAQLMKDGDVDGAIVRLIAINDLDPTFPQTYYNLGIAYLQKEDYPKSIENLNKAIELKNNFPQAYYTLGVIYEDLATTTEESLKQKGVAQQKKEEGQKLISDNLNNSIQNYSKYLEISPTAEDKNEIQSKLEYLKQELTKYPQPIEE